MTERNRNVRTAGWTASMTFLLVGVIVAGATMLYIGMWASDVQNKAIAAATADPAGDSDAPVQPSPSVADTDPLCEAAYNWAKNDNAADYAITAFGNANPRPDLTILKALREGKLNELRPEHCLTLEDRRVREQQCDQYGMLKPERCRSPEDNRWVMELYIEPPGVTGHGIHLLLCSRGGVIAWALPQPEDRTERCLRRLTAAHLQKNKNHKAGMI